MVKLTRCRFADSVATEIGKTLACLVHGVENRRKHGSLVDSASLVNQRIDLDTCAAFQKADQFQRDDHDCSCRHRCRKKACAASHADGGDNPNAGCAGQPADAAAIVEDEARTQKADALNDVGGNLALIGLPSPANTAERSVKKAAPTQISRLVRTPAAFA